MIEEEPKDIYSNCIMENPDGQFMCFCSKNRMRSYLRKGIAEQINGNTFRLKFTPKGHGHDPNTYMGEYRKSLCVVCGTKENLTKHHVVPYAYRRYLPSRYKDKNNFDVLLLCIDHHTEYERKADVLHYELKKPFLELEKEIGVLFRARHIIQTLQKHDLLIPIDRAEYMIDTVQELTGDDSITLDNLDTSSIENRLKELGTVSGKVTESIKDIHAFILMWRKHFLEHMNPQFISEKWMAEHETYF